MEVIMSITLPAIKASFRLANHCPNFDNCTFYKNIADAAILALPLKKRPTKRLWSILNFLQVLCYSWLRGCSIERAEKRLNKQVLFSKPAFYQQIDKHRYARAYPHQTAVNHWLRALSYEDIERMARIIFAEGLKRQLLKNQRGKKIIVEFDFTYLGYWGKRRDVMIKGTTLVKGAKRMRHYHAAYIHGAGISQYIAVHHTAKGESMITFMGETIDHLQQLGFKIQWVLADREYYNQEVLDLVKAKGSKLITPVKEYQQLQDAKRAYLKGKKGRIQQYKLGQMAQAGKKAPAPTKCWLYLIATEDYNLGRIRQQYQRGQITEAIAMGCITGLITNAPPQRHGKGFANRLQAYYRQRWQIETAFRVTDEHQAIYRSNFDSTRYFCEMGHFFMYNEWQAECGGKPHKLRFTFQDYRNNRVDEITQSVNL
jgi:hypothetical protein